MDQASEMGVLGVVVGEIVVILAGDLLDPIDSLLIATPLPTKTSKRMDVDLAGGAKFFNQVPLKVAPGSPGVAHQPFTAARSQSPTSTVAPQAMTPAPPLAHVSVVALLKHLRPQLRELLAHRWGVR